MKGDDALLELARHRLQQSDAGAEIYASTPDEMNHLLTFRPSSESPVIVHLPHEINILDQSFHRLILDFASLASKEKVYGLVLHDHHKLVGLFSDYKNALKKINNGLKKIPGSPYLFIEYAAMIDPNFYCELITSIKPLNKVSGCIDIGHIGVRRIYQRFRKLHKNIDVFNLNPCDKRLPDLINDIESATSRALGAVCHVIQAVGGIGKPVHFHLHDGHPLATSSPFGFSDHNSFFQEIPIPFPYKGKMSLKPMFGEKGLKEIVKTALKVLAPNKISFTLEIHPVPGYLHLSDVGHFFRHWKHKANAEQMNYWLMILRQHQAFLQKTISGCLRDR